LSKGGHRGILQKYPLVKGIILSQSPFIRRGITVFQNPLGEGESSPLTIPLGEGGDRGIENEAVDIPL